MCNKDLKIDEYINEREIDKLLFPPITPSEKRKKVDEYDKQNRKKKREYAKQYYLINKEKKKQQVKEWQKDNYNYLLLYQKEWRKKKKELVI